MESEWQQVFSNLQNLPEYSTQSHQCWIFSLIFNSFSLFPRGLFQELQQQMVSLSPSYSTGFFSSLAIFIFFNLLTFFYFHCIVCCSSNIHLKKKFFFPYQSTVDQLFLFGLDDVCMTTSQRILCVSFSWTDSGLFKYYLFVQLDF